VPEVNEEFQTMANNDDKAAFEKIRQLSKGSGINIAGAKVRRTSSRFCLGVEHGDYNGTELFGVGTDRFIWMAYKPSGSGKMRLFSGNFPEDGVIEFELGSVPKPKKVKDSWARFPYGVDYVLQHEGFELTKGFDAVIYGNIPGGGMSRSASLSLNLIGSLLEVNGIEVGDKFKIVDMAQAVENDYIGSPCGQLDQIMILFAKANMGTHYNPKNRTIDYVPLGNGAADFRIVVMDTGTVRPGLEKSTYKIRRAECEELVSILQKADFEITCLADITDENLCNRIIAEFRPKHPDLCDRLKYIFGAQHRFYRMLEAWKKGDIETVGRIFRTDGLGLRDDYKISGPELEAMCDIARSVDGVLGERMLGGGDKGASGSLVLADAVDALRDAVDAQYKIKCPDFADKYATHVCKIVDGVTLFDSLP
jgi:galactokinase